MSKLVRCLIVSLAVLSVIGCTSCRENTKSHDELDGTHWMLRTIKGANLVENSYISLYFRDGHTWGSSGCNTYAAKYAVASSDKLRFSDGVFTLVACSKEINDQETSYANAFRSVESYQIAGDQLILGDASGQGMLVFGRLPKYAANPAKLVNTKWRLVSVGGTPVDEGLNATLNFDDSGGASGTAGPFKYEFKYQARGDDIWWTEQGVKRVTMAAAPADGEAGHFISALGFAASYRLVNGQLQMYAITGDKDTLVFVPEDK